MFRERLVRAADRLLESELVNAAVASRALTRPGLIAGTHPAVTAVEELEHAETTTFSEPTAGSDVWGPIADHPTEWTAPEWTVCECRDVQLVGPEGLSLLPGGDVLLENSLGWTKRAVLSAFHSLRDHELPVRSSAGVRTFEAGLSLVGPWTDNYYHWHLDYLSRLAPILESDDRDPPLLLPPDTTSWMRESLRLLGFTETDWTVLDGRRATVERLTVPTMPRGTPETARGLEYLEYTYNAASIRVVASEMRSRSSDSLPDELRDVDRVFVSRRGADRRFVRNLYELRPILEEYGVRIVRPEQYSVAAQVELFGNADLVVGPHGAGLTNLLFTEDATCVELFGEYVHPAFYALANQVGVDYVCLDARGDGPGLSVSPERLREGIELALGE